MSYDEWAVMEDVATTRAHVAKLKAERDAEQKALEETLAWHELQTANDNLRVASLYLSDAEERARDLALAKFAETGETKAIEGLQVIQSKTMDYDLGEVTDWCRDNAPALFIVDEKAFKKVAATLPGAPVVLGTKPSVRIASDLSAYLKEDGNQAEA